MRCSLSGGPSAYPTARHDGFVDTSLTNVTTSGFDWTGTVSVTGGELVDSDLNTGGSLSEGPSADVSDTRQVSFSGLLSGVTDTPASNTFLTRGPADAAEPTPLPGRRTA